MKPDLSTGRRLTPATERKSLKVLGIVPSGRCFGLQNLTLSFFGATPKWLRPYFLNTRWADGEFGRRLDALGISHSSTWLGMFSRRLDLDNLRMTFWCLLKLPLAWRDFLRLYASFRPDLIYLANHHEAILLFPLLLPLRRKVVCHMHDPPPPNVFQKRSFRVWRRGIGRFLFISKDVKARLNQVGALASGDLVIYNGVEIRPAETLSSRTKRFCEMFDWPDDCAIFGITGQISAAKGHEDFVEAAVLLHSVEPKARFVIGGRGDPVFTASVQALVEERGATGYVGFCGWLPRAQDFYEGIDVLVLASRHDEGFGLVVAEAAERAIPAIATKSGGAVEIIVDEETGLLVEKGDPAGLADAMNRLADDPELRGHMGKRARRHIEENFDLQFQAEKFADLLYGLVHP